MFTRRQLLIAGAAGMATSLSGCFTQRLFEPKIYREKISSVLVSEDNKNLVIFTEQYHYIFDLPPELATVLKGELHSHVKASLFQFQVDAERHITGKYELLLPPDSPEHIKQVAIAAGFDSSGISMNGELSGMRYDANGVHPPANLQLNQEYEVTISAEQTSGEKAAKALLTPITVTADGVVVLVTVPLGIIMFTTLLIVCGMTPHGCK